jgi:hypothetical protein
MNKSISKDPLPPCIVCGRELFAYYERALGYPKDFVCCTRKEPYCIVCCPTHRSMWIRVGAIDDFEVWVADERRKSAQCP